MNNAANLVLYVAVFGGITSGDFMLSMVRDSNNVHEHYLNNKHLWLLSIVSTINTLQLEILSLFPTDI